MHHVTPHLGDQSEFVLFGEYRQHLRRFVETDDGTSIRCQRRCECQGDAPCTDTKLEHVLRMVFAQYGHDCSEIIGVAVPVVVNIGERCTVGEGRVIQSSTSRKRDNA